MATKKFCRYFSFIVLFQQTMVSGECDYNVGPAGSPECVLLTPYYQKYQWGTCLTNSYIQTVSKGNASCRDHYATYCYYQCMMELYKIAEGDVRDECTCGVDSPQQTRPPQTNLTQLPARCYSPAGDDCEWYAECLERRFPCREKQQTSYAISNGETFCNLYQKHYHMFSTEGQRWIDAVRGCLQTSLVPLLRPFLEITCDEIKEKAFKSHSSCYVYPRKNSPSFCDLSGKDKGMIFYTVVPRLLSNCLSRGLCKDIFISIQQLREVNKMCEQRQTIFYIEDFARNIQMIYVGINGETRPRRAVYPKDDYSAGARLILTVAEKMKWESKGVTWIAYFQNNITAEENKQNVTQYLNIVLAPSKPYNLNDKSNISSDVNMTNIVDEVTNAFRTGILTATMIKGISISQYRLCADYECSNATLEFDPLNNAKTSKLTVEFWTIANIVLIVSGSALLLLVILTLIFCINRRRRSDKII